MSISRRLVRAIVRADVPVSRVPVVVATRRSNGPDTRSGTTYPTDPLRPLDGRARTANDPLSSVTAPVARLSAPLAPWDAPTHADVPASDAPTWPYMPHRDGCRCRLTGCA